MKALLKQVIFDQQIFSHDKWVERSIPQSLIDCKEVLVISGIRRCGKSVLLQQIRAKQAEKDYCLNFDDDRLAKFSVDNFQQLYEVFIELFGEQKTFYFDEIQNISGWELFVRRIYDKGCKVFVTGSNAKMLSRELGTHLTGRYCSYELYPFSFSEYLDFLTIKIKPGDFYSTVGVANLTKYFNQYLYDGGFPQYTISRNEIYLKSLYESILYKDVMVRNKLTNEKEILELVYFLASNVAKLSSYSSLARLLGLKHPVTIKNYIEHIENTYLIFQISKYDYSLKKQLANPKKTYFIDNAIVHKLGFNISENYGRLFENLVFIELKRRAYEIFYHSDKTECDFVIRQASQIVQAIQVCYTLNNETRNREIKGLLDAMNIYNLDKGLIITTDKEEEIEIEGKQISIVAVWEWLLLPKM
jgi:predicted AAA+ superfamily ATPase